MAPVAGHNLKLSLNAQLQRVGEQALAQSMSLNDSPGGSFVAMNPDTGAVYAMGSLPTFDPSIFTGNLSQAKYDQLTNPNGGDAAAQPRDPERRADRLDVQADHRRPPRCRAGEWTTGDVFDDTGQFCVGTGAAQQCRHNAGHAVDGSLNLADALRVSSDDFFYNLGARLNVDPSKAPNGRPAGHLGLQVRDRPRTPTSICPTRRSGRCPPRPGAQSRNKLEAECDTATGPFKWTNGHVTSSHHHKGWYRTKKHAPGGCGIADGTNRPWSIGDNESLAVGQGDVQVTPLQLAVAYSALANGGTIVRPHFGVDVQDQDGTVLQTINPPPSRHIAINPFYRQTDPATACTRPLRRPAAPPTT